jgi:hypothetical protein
LEESLAEPERFIMSEIASEKMEDPGRVAKH